MRLLTLAAASLASAAPALAGETVTYRYDALGRLVQVTRSGTESGATSTYSYDAADNRTNVSVTGLNRATCRGPNSDFNGDGRDDVLWRNTSGTVSNWLGEADGGYVINDTIAWHDIFHGWRVVGTGDFNGDARDDMLLRGETGTLTDWLAQSNGAFVNNDANASQSVPTSWSVTCTGDFNGDGRGDVLWRNDNGDLSNWLGQANGGFADNGVNAGTAVATSWRVAGVGDFNGDGRSDVLWRHDNGEFGNWLGQANGGFVENGANSGAQVATSWKVSGVGDFNGDGRDDVLWRNDNGDLSNWLGQTNGGFTDNGVNSGTSVSTAWKVVDIGDYNGDGRDDILWRNDGGAVTNWLATAAGGFVINDANAYSDVPLYWQIEGN